MMSASAAMQPPMVRSDDDRHSDTMNPLAPSEEQKMYREMVQRFFRDTVSEVDLGRGCLPPAHWSELASLGVMAVLLPESAGGLAGGPGDIAVIGEECGRALAITPLAESVVGAAGLLARSSDDALVARYAGAVIEGTQTIAWAAGSVTVSAGDRLHGELPVVRWGGQASILVIPTDHGVFIVDPAAGGVALEPGTLIDGTPSANVSLEGAAAQRLATPEGAVEEALAMAQLFYIAEMVGAMALLHRQTAEYTQQREQFGTPISTFQAVQHKLARMFIWLEQSRSLLLKASTGDPASPDFRRAVISAKAYVSEAAQRLAEEAVQLHGGIGVTEELVVGRGLRRITVLARLFGGAEQARAQSVS